MKVIYINRYFYPDHAATSQILSELVFDLAERGYDIHIITSRLKYDGGRLNVPNSEETRGVKVHRVYSSGFGRKFILGRLIDYLTFYLTCAWMVFRLTDKEDIVVTKTDPPLLSILISPVVRLKRGRVINWLQDIFPEVASRMGMGGRILAPFFLLLKWFRNYSLKMAEMNIVPGKLMARHLQQEGITEDRLHVIPNWSDGKIVYPVEPVKNGLRQEWKLKDKFVVGYSGNFGRAHEFDGILATLIRLSDSNPDIIFLFIGGGAQFNKLRKIVNRKKLNNTLFKPYQNKEDLAQSLSVPDVHLVSLKPELEGLIVPSKFYGIAAAGRATVFIGDKNGEIPFMLEESGCGIAVTPGDGTALSEAILSLKNNIDQCTNMGKEARSIFLQRYEKAYGIQRWDVLLSNLQFGGGDNE